MPVYIRKNVNFTPPSIDKIPLEDDDDYITDPDQLKDRLPQPYRMIDKVLSKFYDDVWEIIEQRENKRLEESRKIRPPQYECAVQMKILGNACCMCDSVDGRYIFIGYPQGLAAIDAVTQDKVATWEEDRVEVHTIKAYLIGVQIYLILSIDDMGFARLHAFAGDQFYFIKVLNEFHKTARSRTSQYGFSEGGTKLLVSKLEASKDGDYIGAVMENPESQDVWLEIHKLPRDAWLNEIDVVLTQIKKEAEKREQKLESAKGLEEEGGGETAGDTEAVEAPQEGQISVSQSYEDTDTTERKTPKFSPTSLVFKLKPPPSTAGNQSSSIHSACTKIDSGEVIGTGINHILSPSNLERRKDVFKHLHDNLIDYLPKTDNVEENLLDVNFHFMTAGRLVPIGLEQPSQTENEEEFKRLPTTLAVWWSNSSHLMHYSLLKQHKDPENIKPDLVWPYTSKISCTTMSTDSSLIAVALHSGNVVIWDRYLGIQRGVVNIGEEGEKLIVLMKFLDPVICPQIFDDYQPYQIKTSAHLMVVCDDGSVYVLISGPGIQPDPICVSPRIENGEEMFSHVEVIPGVPDLMTTCLRSGKVQIRDILKGKILCETILPKSHELATPWEPLLGVGGMGQMLYVRGLPRSVGDDDDPETAGPGEDSDTHGSLFVYQLRSFPTLDSYLGKQRDPVPYMVHSTMEKRVDALLKERIAQQGLRKTRMQERWGYLKEEIWSILQYKDQADKRAENRPEVHFKTVRNTSQTPGSSGWRSVFN